MNAIPEKIQLNLFEIIGEVGNSGDCITKNTQTMIKIMLKTGMSPKAISALLELTGLRKEHKQYFGAPIISSASLWHDAIPYWLRLAIYQERLEIICDEHNQNKVGVWAGYPEAVAVLMTASLESPLHSEWADIYTWVGREVSIKYNGMSKENFKGVCDKDELSSYEKDELNRLLADIRRKVIKSHY
jgi:hypothetical protein